MRKKFLQIGLGSMGKRRIRNLLANGITKENIFGFDLSEERRKETEKKYQIETYADFDIADKAVSPDAYIISTPPHQHSQYFLHAAKKKKHFFVEVTSNDSGYDEVAELLDGNFIGAPSSTFRYFSSIKKIKAVLAKGEIGKVLSFQYHLGQYLPDWHPWEDYRQVYFAQKETGGCREMFVFELIWLTDVLQGKVKKINGMTEKISDLDMTADDIYSAVMQFDNGIVGNIAIDLLSRKPLRTLRVIGSEGVLEWDWLEYQLKIFKAGDKIWQTIDLPQGQVEDGYTSVEEMYIDEIKNFLQAIRGEVQYPYTFVQDRQILKTLYALEQSAKKGKAITL